VTLNILFGCLHKRSNDFGKVFFVVCINKLMTS
jgi:hypothetical protein